MCFRGSVSETAGKRLLPACVHVFLLLLGRSYIQIDWEGGSCSYLTLSPSPLVGDAVQTFFSHWQAEH